jgi:fused signal recognition particle receptor
MALITLFTAPEPTPGVIDRMKDAVSRTRDSLQDKMSDLVARARPVDESALEELENALIASDIGVATSQEIIGHLRQASSRQQIGDGVELRRLLKQEMLRILDETPQAPAEAEQKPAVILMVGVNGTGKTTTAGKLAAYFRAKGNSVLLCAADTFRAAAIEQLEVWSERAGVDLIRTRQGGDPSAALYDALKASQARGIDVLIVDTAGRLHTKSNLMAELDKIRRTAQKFVADAPHQTLLVIDATTGQNGLQQARLFTEAVAVSGIVLTKLDGTAKGGIVIAIARELKLPVRFVGTGERMEDLLPFDSHAFVDSLLES